MPSTSNTRSPLIDALATFLPPERISSRHVDRLIYSRDMWPRTLFSLRENVPSICPPDLIVWPETSQEVARIIQIARKHDTPVVPYGAGSGVCGGAMAQAGGVIIDLKRMNRLLEINVDDHLARFECGIIGQILEDQLNLRGMTLGHFPSSIYCSTLGGWLAARSAGQFSSRYGKIEDMLESLEVVTGEGHVIECRADDLPDLSAAIVGSEGTLGVITRATLLVKPLPSYRLFRAYEFPRVAAGCEAIRRVMQRGLRPMVVRLYDQMDTLMARPSADDDPSNRSMLEVAAALLPENLIGVGTQLKEAATRAALARAGALSRVAEALVPRLGGGCLMVFGFEGEPAIARAELAICHAETLACGGHDLGEGPGLSWFEKRYAVSYKMSPIFASGSFVDTMEVASTWDRLMDLYAEVRQALASQAVVLAHFSHAYSEGCSIYFTFAAAAEDRQSSEALYDELWRRGLAAVARAGGTISHHHGVGLSKAAFMAREHGEAMSIYRRIKAALDPGGVLNPKKMGL